MSEAVIKILVDQPVFIPDMKYSPYFDLKSSPEILNIKFIGLHCLILENQRTLNADFINFEPRKIEQNQALKNPKQTQKILTYLMDSNLQI